MKRLISVLVLGFSMMAFAGETMAPAGEKPATEKASKTEKTDKTEKKTDSTGDTVKKTEKTEKTEKIDK